MKNKPAAPKTLSLKSPLGGYYPGENLLRLEKICSELLSALEEIQERCSDGAPFAGDDIERIASAAISRATGEGA